MRLKEFEEVISESLDGLPPAIQAMLENVDVVAAHFPTREQLQEQGLSSRYDLLGLYEGIPLTQRDSGYGLVLPDRIMIFRGPIEATCATKEEMEAEIRKTVVHELAHHFGISDEKLEEMGRY